MPYFGETKVTNSPYAERSEGWRNLTMFYEETSPALQRSAVQASEWRVTSITERLLYLMEGALV
jgi:hypothetical protein